MQCVPTVAGSGTPASAPGYSTTRIGCGANTAPDSGTVPDVIRSAEEAVIDNYDDQVPCIQGQREYQSCGKAVSGGGAHACAAGLSCVVQSAYYAACLRPKACRGPTVGWTTIEITGCSSSLAVPDLCDVSLPPPSSDVALYDQSVPNSPLDTGDQSSDPMFAEVIGLNHLFYEVRQRACMVYGAATCT